MFEDILRKQVFEVLKVEFTGLSAKSYHELDLLFKYLSFNFIFFRADNLNEFEFFFLIHSNDKLIVLVIRKRVD